jgi:hypothetical protein
MAVQRVGDRDEPGVVELGMRVGPVHAFEPRGRLVP